jgi:hypothetical protein
MTDFISVPAETDGIGNGYTCLIQCADLYRQEGTFVKGEGRTLCGGGDGPCETQHILPGSWREWSRSLGGISDGQILFVYKAVPTHRFQRLALTGKFAHLLTHILYLSVFDFGPHFNILCAFQPCAMK